MPLRNYQQDAVDSVYHYLQQHDGNPLVVLPTGAGKSYVIAQMCADAVNRWGSRVLCLCHVRELLEQNVAKVRLIDPSLDVGIYSAGMGCRDTDNAIIVGGIQSISRPKGAGDNYVARWRTAKIKELCQSAPFDLVIIDEAHMVPVKDQGRYRQLVDDLQRINPNHRIVGLTATAYRLDSGTVCSDDSVFSSICHEVGVRRMVDEGWLCRMVGRRLADSQADLSGVRIRAGEFAANEMQAAFIDKVKPAVTDMLRLVTDRKSVLVFAAGVEHARQICVAIQDQSESAVTVALVTGETPKDKRDNILRDFQGGKIKYVVNCNVLTTGFDSPNIDCVAVIRATKSPGLFSQMVGRGFRTCSGKDDCLVLDFGGNLRRHGPVDDINPPRVGGGSSPQDQMTKTCPQCQAEVAARCQICPYCGYESPEPQASHDTIAATDAVMSDEVTPTDYPVARGVFYSVHKKRKWKNGDPLSVRVDYCITSLHTISEWVCVEHTGFARSKAEEWWATHSNYPVPDTAPEAVNLLNSGVARQPAKILVLERPGEFARIKGRTFDGPVPEVDGVDFDKLMDEVPF